MKDIIFDDFSSAFGLLKEVKKGTVQPSGDKFIWSCQQAMTEAEKKIVVMHTPFDQIEMPTCPITLYKGRVIHQETGDLDWCIPDSKISLEAGYSREQVGVAKRICKLHNEAEYLGYSDWRLPTIYELSIFEDQELAELLGKDKKKYWTSNKVKLMAATMMMVVEFLDISEVRESSIKDIMIARKAGHHAVTI